MKTQPRGESISGSARKARHSGQLASVAIHRLASSASVSGFHSRDAENIGLDMPRIVGPAPAPALRAVYRRLRQWRSVSPPEERPALVPRAT